MEGGLGEEWSLNDMNIESMRRFEDGGFAGIAWELHELFIRSSMKFAILFKDTGTFAQR